MEHTKKFVLVDPRFVRPSMRDKVLSDLDSNISSILNSDDSDEIKAKNYISALGRFRNYSAPVPEKRETNATPSVPATVTTRSLTPSASIKSPQKRVKRTKVEPLATSPLPDRDPTLWRRTRRTRTKKRFGTQWIEYNGSTKKKPINSNWLVK